jgi:hypothetical protein
MPILPAIEIPGGGNSALPPVGLGQRRTRAAPGHPQGPHVELLFHIRNRIAAYSSASYSSWPIARRSMK